jgi:hypothetical protein
MQQQQAEELLCFVGLKAYKKKDGNQPSKFLTKYPMKSINAKLNK